MRSSTLLLLAAPIAAAILVSQSATAADDRQMVELPAMMQDHMLGNMRDHLAALDDVLAALAAGDVAAAGKMAEQRIGLSSLEMHGAAHMGPFMPEGMRALGTELHRAASRFAVVAQDAEVEHTYESQQAVFAALREMTAACNGCHAGYRIR